MILLALLGNSIGGWWRRAIVALARPAPHYNREVPPPEYYRFPIF
jgi:hypothetical protein